MDKGYSLERDVLDAKLVDECTAIYTGSNHKFQETISGQYQQLDILNPKVISAQELSQFKQNITDVLVKRLSTLLPESKSWVSHQMKFLTAEPGSSEQLPHRDSDEHDFIVCAIYLTNNQSTDVSVHPYANVNLKNSTALEKLAYWPLPWPSKTEDFQSFPVNPGDVMFFRPDFLHRGIKNLSKDTRIVLFSVLGPRDSREFDDNYSIFEFTFAETVYGRGSRQHLEAMSRCRQYLPLNHYPRKRTRNMLNRKLVNFERSKRIKR